MRVEAGRITAEITNCPLQRVLQELAERTGIIFEIQSQENPQVWLRLNDVLYQEAITRIASGSNTIFYYGKNAQGEEIITLVRVLPRAKTPLQPSLTYLGTGVVTKINDDVDTPEQALKLLEESTSVESREKAINFLAKTKSKAAIKPLILAMSDPAPEIRVASIEGLAAMGARAALLDILKCLKDTRPEVRRSATNAVALLGNATNLKDVRPLGRDRDAGVVAAAETAIRMLSTAGKK